MPDLETLRRAHDKLFADYDAAEEAGKVDEAREILEAMTCVELAYCGHPDRPLPEGERTDA